MQTPSSLENGVDVWRTYVAERTKAMPKNSLFGTTLENADRRAANGIDAKIYEESELKKRREKAQQYEPKIPEQFKHTSAKSRMEKEQNHLSKHKQESTERQQAIKDMESRAKYFQNIPSVLNKNKQVKKKMLLAEPGLDFELKDKMNSVGYSEKFSYNRERHQPKAPVHKYAVIGDPLEYGMDFSLNQTETNEKYNTPKSIEEQARYYRSRRQNYSAPIIGEYEVGGIPANIRARYGSKFIDELFADEQALSRVKEQMNNERIKRQRKHEKRDLPAVEVTTPRNYGDISHALRQDKFNGYTFHQPTSMKESHTKEVFERRYKDPDEFRHQWDEYGKWKEKEILREKMEKDFESYIESQPKFTANWDRNAVASRPKKEIIEKPAKKPKTVQRKKVPPKQMKHSKEPAEFEPVVFETPPMTPDPTIPEYVPVVNTNKKDDDFWNFYDQGLPPIS